MVYSAVTVTERKPKTVVFRQNRGEPNLGILEPSEYGFTIRRLCLYMVQSQWVGSGEEAESAIKVFSVAKFSNLKWKPSQH